MAGGGVMAGSALAGTGLGSARVRTSLRPEGSQMGELQRARVLAGAVGAFDELGYERATVAHITARARVSRRTFYELFSGREECLAAVLEGVVGQLAAELAAAGLGGVSWRERMRRGLWTILAYLDREPALARVCVVEALRAGPRVLARREELLGCLGGAVDGGRRERSGAVEVTSLAAEGVVGAACAIVYARLLRRERRPLTELQGELVAMIVLPYLGPAAARRERACPAPDAIPAASPLACADVPRTDASRMDASRAGQDLLEGVPMRLTYRTARVLEAVAELGGRGHDPSNRTVGERAGVRDPGQISKLLARLERLGLLANTGAGAHSRGEPNAWALTAKGERVARSVRLGDRSEAA